MIRLVLPYPVSANRYWRSVVPRNSKRALVIRSDEAKSYTTQVAWLAKAAGCRTPTARPIDLRVTLVPKNGVVMDLDNCLKVTIDALKGIVYADDKQVRRILAEYADPDGRGAVIVEIAEFVPAPTPIEEAATCPPSR